MRLFDPRNFINNKAEDAIYDCVHAVRRGDLEYQQATIDQLARAWKADPDVAALVIAPYVNACLQEIEQ